MSQVETFFNTLLFTFFFFFFFLKFLGRHSSLRLHIGSLEAVNGL